MESMWRLDIPFLLDDIRQGGDDPSTLGSGTELLTCLDYIEGVHELEVRRVPMLQLAEAVDIPRARYILSVSSNSRSLECKQVRLTCNGSSSECILERQGYSSAPARPRAIIA
jgi:hypothetical protein